MNQLVSLEMEVERSLKSIEGAAMRDAYRTSILGKRGRFTAVLREMGRLTVQDRITLGNEANLVRDQIIEMFDGERHASDKKRD